MQPQNVSGHPNLMQPKRNTYLTFPKTQSFSAAMSSNGQQQVMQITLPSGWKREEALRPTGLGTGKTDVYYISPQGQKVRTKQEMKMLLGDKYDISLFDWRSGKFLSQPPKSRSPEDSSEVLSAKIPHLDTSPNPLQRRTSPPDTIKPVVIRSHPNCKRADMRNLSMEPPRQLFWEKRLADQVAIDSETNEPCKPLSLPRGVQSAGVPGYRSPQLINSLLYAIATKTSPIAGQEQAPSAIEKNPCVAVNTLQPMIKAGFVMCLLPNRFKNHRHILFRRKTYDAKKCE
ncbi:methyl-CpG-binding domain protein 2 [Fasciola gigantica]|uniref:Methyl-CpG-binding domain protein 2 n=1 Tax=Fasciola gigantica TaxID=46835 RepID=A0A504XNQ6_FASGI|nr:methyl-CpG-binding domain protein 2 [Fasciola gigantica]